MTLVSIIASSSFLQEPSEALDTIKPVDGLLDRTRILVANGSKHHTIAYSVILDSSLGAALVHHLAALGKMASAVLGLFPAVYRVIILELCGIQLFLAGLEWNALLVVVRLYFRWHMLR